MAEAAGFTLVNARGASTSRARTALLLAEARAHPRPAVQTFVPTLAHTGCRISEAPALRAKDVALAAAELRFRTIERRREHWRGPAGGESGDALCPCP